MSAEFLQKINVCFVVSAERIAARGWEPPRHGINWKTKNETHSKYPGYWNVGWLPPVHFWAAFLQNSAEFCRILIFCRILQDSAEFCRERASAEMLVKAQLLQKQYCMTLQIWKFNLILCFLNIFDVALTSLHTQNYVLQKSPRESILQDFWDSAEFCRILQNCAKFCRILCNEWIIWSV